MIRLPEKKRVKCKICKFNIQESMMRAHIEIVHNEYYFPDIISENISKYFEMASDKKWSD